MSVGSIVEKRISDDRSGVEYVLNAVLCVSGNSPLDYTHYSVDHLAPGDGNSGEVHLFGNGRIVKTDYSGRGKVVVPAVL